MTSEDNAPRPDVPKSSFADLGLKPEIINVLSGTHLDRPTPLQCDLLPRFLAGKDCFVLARSGAGKTNGFVLPIVQRIEPRGGVQALLISPTRSTALRIKRCFERFQQAIGFTVAVHAGGGKRAVRDPLDEPPDVLIATPRCARDLMDEKTPAWFETVRTIVVDDADAILDLGDRESLDRVFEGLGHEHQRILLAAEAGGDVDDLAEARLPGAERVEFAADAPAPTRVRQVAIEIGERDAGDVLIDFVKQEHPKLVIVFTNDARSAERIAMRLSRARVSCRTVGQSRRPRDGDRRRPDPRGRGGSEVVVTHDPAPRRLSTIPASHVVHMELPADAETYFRRLRQCDRLHRRGSSIAFIGPDDAAVVESIESLLGTSLERILGPRPVERSRPKRGGPRRDGAARAGSSGGETAQTGSSGDAPTGTNAPAAPAEEARPPSPAPATSSTTHRPPPPRTLGSRLPVKRKKRLR